MPDFSLEMQYQGLVAGVDEVGRGPCAGPVVAAAVLLDQNALNDLLIYHINDSKLLSDKKRRQLNAEIVDSVDYGIGMASVAEIDQINILQASLLAMKRAVAGLNQPPNVLLVDGTHAPAVPCQTITVIRGDNISCSIAVASIIAKVYRDDLMIQLDVQYPGYGWARNAGYGTAQHLLAIEDLGVTPHHRRSFAPVRRRLALAG